MAFRVVWHFTEDEVQHLPSNFRPAAPRDAALIPNLHDLVRFSEAPQDRFIVAAREFVIPLDAQAPTLVHVHLVSQPPPKHDDTGD